jgi:hypothetical protein
MTSCPKPASKARSYADDDCDDDAAADAAAPAPADDDDDAEVMPGAITDTCSDM